MVNIRIYIFLSAFLIARISFSQCVSNTSNGSFEQPLVTSPAGWDIFFANLVPDWSTTDVFNQVEIWDGTVMGIPAYDGNQFAELNAASVSTLYVDICTPCSDTVKWQFAHRGRDGVDVCNLKAGPPGGPYTIVTTASDDNVAWKLYQGIYIVPPGQTVTRFLYESVSAAGGDVTIGNLLDAVSYVFSGFALPPPTHTDVSCDGNNGTATAIAPDGAPYTYLWNTIPAQTTAAITNLSAGSYTVIVTNAGGCTSARSVTITQPSLFTASVIAHTNISCNGYNNGNATVSAFGGTGSSYTYSWNTIPVQNTAMASGLSSSTYSVTVTDSNGCKAKASIFISEPAILSTTIVSSGNVSCFGGNNGYLTASANGGTPDYSYLWNNGQNNPLCTGLMAGTYTVTVMDANGCKSNATGIITEPAVLTVNITSSTNVSCNGGNNGTATASGIGGTTTYSYLWNNDQNTPTATGLIVGNYTVTVTDANGCTANNSVIVTATVIPLTVSFLDQASGCAPVCVNFSNTTPNSISCVWNFGDGSASSNLCDDFHCYTTAGEYDVSLTITDANNCSNTLVKPGYITVYENPVADFSMNSQITMFNSTIDFSDQSTGATSWQWSFGDVNNSSSTLQNPQFTYQDTGVYAVQLIVTSAYGCSDTILNTLRVNPEYTIYLPNTFTPNGDGINDFFIPKGMGIEIDTYELQIYNRWGNLIFESDNMQKGWDGRVNGSKEIAQIGTYVWKLNAKDAFKQQHRYIGHVNLIK